MGHDGHGLGRNTKVIWTPCLRREWVKPAFSWFSSGRGFGGVSLGTLMIIYLAHSSGCTVVSDGVQPGHLVKIFNSWRLESFNPFFSTSACFTRKASVSENFAILNPLCLVQFVYPRFSLGSSSGPINTKANDSGFVGQTEQKGGGAQRGLAASQASGSQQRLEFGYYSDIFMMDTDFGRDSEAVGYSQPKSATNMKISLQ